MLYKGSCRCGKVAFEVEGELSGAISCDCSICSRKGARGAQGEDEYRDEAGEHHAHALKYAARPRIRLCALRRHRVNISR